MSGPKFTMIQCTCNTRGMGGAIEDFFITRI